MDEGLATTAGLAAWCSLDAMYKLCHSHRRKDCPLIPCSPGDLLEHLCDGLAAALSGDRNTGVQHYSHAGGMSGSRWLSMISSKSWPKSPSSVTTEPWASARAMDSESKRPGCDSADLSTATGRASCSITISAPARTRARSDEKSLAASASDTWINPVRVAQCIPAHSSFPLPSTPGSWQAWYPHFACTRRCRPRAGPMAPRRTPGGSMRVSAKSRDENGAPPDPKIASNCAEPRLPQPEIAIF